MLIEVGGKCFHKKVYIFQENISYNLLLGKSWIYKLRAIKYILHCLIKFMHKGKIITIHAKDKPTDVC